MIKMKIDHIYKTARSIKYDAKCEINDKTQVSVSEVPSQNPMK